MAGKNHTYHEKRETGYILQLRELLAGLPPYTRDYFRAIEQKSSAKTRISYAYDFQVFLRFLTEKNPALKDKAIRDITLGDLNNLTALDIEEYQEYLRKTGLTALQERCRPFAVCSTISLRRNCSQKMWPCRWICPKSTKKPLSIWSPMRWLFFLTVWKAMKRN